MNGGTELPANWVPASIREFAETRTGGTPRRNEPRYFGGTIPWVKSGELGDGAVHTTDESITEIGLAESNAKVFPAGTLCIALYGATVGKLGILGTDAATNQAVCGIFLPPWMNPRYVFWFLQSIRRDLIEQGKGGAQSNISNEIVRSVRVPISPPEEQGRIVAKLDELFSDLDAGVAALERAQANLKRYRAAVLKAAVEGSLTQQWRAEHPDVEPASEVLARILKERRAKWEADKLAEFERKGKTPPKGWREKYAAPEHEDGLFKLPSTWVWASGLAACLRNRFFESPRQRGRAAGSSAGKCETMRPTASQHRVARQDVP